MTTSPTWRERIEAARRRGKFTKKDRDEMNFNESCFVGERLGFIDLDLAHAKRIIDWDAYDELDDLGMKGYAAVKRDNIPEAERIYEAIQRVPLKKEVDAV